MYASAKEVDNIIAVIDLNGQQIDGSTEDVLNMGDLKSKLKTFGWEVLEIENGNDIQNIITIMDKAKNYLFNKKPWLVGQTLNIQMHY